VTHSEREAFNLIIDILLAGDGAKPLVERDKLKDQLREVREDLPEHGTCRRTDALIKIRQITQMVHENVHAKIREIDTIAWEGLR
jgi:hypothetical protein